jgi:DNA-binding response OmpR family regulator
LPDGDGNELAMELHARCRAPVVLITGFDADQARTTGQLENARLLTKPFSADALLGTLRELRQGRP